MEQLKLELESLKNTQSELTIDTCLHVGKVGMNVSNCFRFPNSGVGLFHALQDFATNFTVCNLVRTGFPGIEMFAPFMILDVGNFVFD